MKALRLYSSIFASLILALSLSAQARPTYTVGTVKEFLQRLGPDRTIILRKGDYKLWTVYDQTGTNFQWLEGDEGKELTIDKADNLTIRGQDGAKLITNSLKSYLIGFYGSSRLEIDNLTFARQVAGTEVPDAGTFYAESIKNLSISRSAFSGPSGYPLELWDCNTVNLKDVKIEGGSLGAMSIGMVESFSAKGGGVSNVQGFPLIYTEESASLTFDGTTFSDNSGSNFVEIYPTDGEESSVVFTKCGFVRNNFDNFVGNKNLPETVNCTFTYSSFDEDWPEYSVDLSSDQSYYGDYDEYGEYGESDTLEYSDEESSLYFSYPSAWDYEESSVPGGVTIFSTDDDSLVFFSKAMEIKTSFDPVKDGPKLFAKALTSLATTLKSEGSLTMKASAAGAPYAFGPFWQQAEYTGTITKQDGSKAFMRLRLTLLSEGVWAFLAISSDESQLEDGEQLETILSSLDYYG